MDKLWQHSTSVNGFSSVALGADVNFIPANGGVGVRMREPARS